MPVKSQSLTVLPLTPLLFPAFVSGLLRNQMGWWCRGIGLGTVIIPLLWLLLLSGKPGLGGNVDTGEQLISLLQNNCSHCGPSVHYVQSTLTWVIFLKIKSL